MLVLSRKQKEAVVVGEVDGFGRLLKITVLEIHHGSVRLGFEAADEVPIHRSEVWERIQGGGLSGKAPAEFNQAVVM
jgi:carbon storage regulator CsrA